MTQSGESKPSSGKRLSPRAGANPINYGGAGIKCESGCGEPHAVGSTRPVYRPYTRPKTQCARVAGVTVETRDSDIERVSVKTTPSMGQYRPGGIIRYKVRAKCV